MRDLRLIYQFVFFADTEMLRPDTEVIGKLLQPLGNSHNLLPSTFTEVELISQAPQTRLRFTTSDESWHVDFESGRISIEKRPTKPRGDNMGSLDAFIQDASSILAEITSRFPTKGTRLSLVTKTAIGRPDAVPAAEKAANFLRRIPFYETHTEVDWGLRQVSRIPQLIGGDSETVNVIVQLQTIEAVIGLDAGESMGDRVQVTVDINTYQRNSAPRFGVDHVKQFGEFAKELEGTLIGQVHLQLNQ